MVRVSSAVAGLLRREATMRLYLSSFRLGNRPDELLRLLGDGRRTALIGNAWDYVSADERRTQMTAETSRLQGLGLVVTEIDLRDYFGKSGQLKTRFEDFDLIWVRGGNPFILRRAFRMSGADAIVTNLLQDDEVVYGGYSAGITIAAPSIAGAATASDSSIVPEGYDSEIVWSGLNIVPYSLVAHYRSDHPGSPTAEQMVAYLIDQHIPFIALRDGEAVVRDENGERIVG
jgi:dipeptidase E